MMSYLLHRSFSLVSALFVALGTLMATNVHAAESQPFFTLRIDSPEAIFNIVEKASGIVDPAGTLGVKTMIAPYKKLSGVKTNGMIGLALQRNENSAFGVDPILFLPLSNVDSFTIPGQEEMITQMKGTLQREGTDRYLLASPAGDFVAYQKKDYVVIAPVSAGDFASAADPKELFANLDKFTIGTTTNFGVLSWEDIEAMLGNIANILVMQGMGEEFDMEAVLNALKQTYEEYSSITSGLTIDERTLTLTSSTENVPKEGSAAAENIKNIKEVKTMFGGFITDTSRTIFSWSYIDYLTDNDIAELKSGLQLLIGSFAEGLYNAEGATEDNVAEGAAEEGSTEGGNEQSNLLAGLFLTWIQENMVQFTENRLIDSAVSFDSDGTFLIAGATKEPDLVLRIGGDLYNALPALIGAEQGEMLRQLIGSKIKLDYETVAGFSLSSVSNLFSEIPEEIAIPAKMKDVPLSVYWAVKKNEAAAIAIGLDAARTERALKNALGKTNAKVTPKQTAVVALKPLGDFISRSLLPLMVKFGVEQTAIEGIREFSPILSSAESSAKVIVTTEFPKEAILQKWQIDGKCFSVFVKLYAKQVELTVKRMTLEQMQQQQQQQTPQEQPGMQGSPEQPAPSEESQPPQEQPAQDGEMQDPFVQ